MALHREVAAAIVIDTCGRFLLQQRDDIAGIIYPGMIGLFGGHREGNESFLECAVRELHEELSYPMPPSRFEHLRRYEGPDFENAAGHSLVAEFYVVRGVPANEIKITEGALLIVEPDQLAGLDAKLTPSARIATATYLLR